MSLSSFSARTLTLLQAGLAGRSINSPGLNGLGTPFSAFRAGTFFFSISVARAASTAATYVLGNSVTAAMFASSSVLVRGFLGAASLAMILFLLVRC